jgi:hypothetical protein
VKPPTDITLDDAKAERVRREHHEAIRGLQRRPEIVVIKDVTLVDSTIKEIAHGLGRPVTVMVSPVRGASTSGRIEEVRSASYDRSKYVVLAAAGWGATITVDLWVMPV